MAVVAHDRPGELPVASGPGDAENLWKPLGSRLSSPWHAVEIVLHIGGQASNSLPVMPSALIMALSLQSIVLASDAAATVAVACRRDCPSNWQAGKQLATVVPSALN